MTAHRSCTVSRLGQPSSAAFDRRTLRRDSVASGGGWVIWATISWPRWRSNPAREQSLAPQQTAECDLNVIWASPGDDETQSFDRVSRSECGCGGRIRTADLRVMSRALAIPSGP